MVFSLGGKRALYKRILLKLSGEALAGEEGCGIDPHVCQTIAQQVQQIQSAGVQVAIVIGGGNVFRGAAGANLGVSRVAGDHMGMLGTLINGIALEQALVAEQCSVQLYSALGPTDYLQPFRWRPALNALNRGEVIICAGGIGNPFFTTDTTAALRAAQFKVDALLKATNVDGIYDQDPNMHPEAQRFTEISYQEVIERNLGVMDLQAISMCRENGIPIIVFAMESLVKAVTQTGVGSVVQ